jgi:hypothetical protein
VSQSTEKSRHLNPDDLISRIDDWTGRDVRWQAPGGGKYMLRVPGAGTDLVIGRDWSAIA